MLHHNIKRNGSKITNQELVTELINSYHWENRKHAKKPNWVQRSKSIKGLRLFLGLSQDRVGQLLGISQKSISFAEDINWRCSDEMQKYILEGLLKIQLKMQNCCTDEEIVNKGESA